MTMAEARDELIALLAEYVPSRRHEHHNDPPEQTCEEVAAELVDEVLLTQADLVRQTLGGEFYENYVHEPRGELWRFPS